MSGDIYISGKSSNNKITISGSGEKKDIDLSTKETNNNLSTQNNNAKYYSDKALESANKAEQSANNAQSYAESVIETKDELLNNEGFVAVSENLETINVVGESIENVNYVGGNIEEINQLVNDLEALGDTTNIEIVASNIDNINSLAEDIQTVEENKNIVLEKVEEAKGYSATASSQAVIATEQATKASQMANSASSSASGASNSASSALSSANIATEKANIAITNAEIAITNAEIATTQASNALKSAENSALSEANAKESENKALSSATSASNSANQASIYSQEAKAFRDEAEEIVTNAGSNASWGNISGTLSNQTDLQAVLDSKADASDIPDVSIFATKSEIPTDYATKIELEAKQDTLTAGENITIENGVISASGGSSVDLTGYIKNQEALADSVAIAIGNTNSSYNSTAVGVEAKTGKYATALGRTAMATGEYSVAVGRVSNAQSTNSVAIGNSSSAWYGGVALGGNAKAQGSGGAIAIGTANASGGTSIAIGWATASATNAIQLGQGTNSTADTFQVWGHKLLDKNTGKIPADRLPDVSIPDEYITDEELQEALKGVGGGHDLFDIVQKDHILGYEETQGYELLGNYVYKEAVAGSRYGYPDFYNKCLAEKEAGTATQVTLGENTVTMYVNANGHQFFDIADKDAVDAFYEATGTAWFYGIDTANERILLPRYDYAELSTKDRVPVVGNGITLGVTNGTNNAGLTNYHQNIVSLYKSAYGLSAGESSGGVSFDNNNKTIGLTTDPEYSGVEADLSSYLSKKYYYMVVGNTSVESAVTDVIDVTTSENDTLPLFHNFWSKEDMTTTGCYVNASLGSWLSGNIYTTAYNTLVAKLGTGNVKSVSDTYTDYDFVVNADDMTFRLPLKNGQEIMFATGVKGNGMSMGLTNGTDNFAWGRSNQNTMYATRSLLGSSVGTKMTSDAPILDDISIGLITNSEYSGIILDTENITIPEGWNLYYKVANAVQNLELLDVAGVTADLNRKVNINSDVIDGQWVNNQIVVSTSATTTLTQHDLSDYLPDDNYNYEVIINLYGQNSSNVAVAIGTDIIDNADVSNVDSGLFQLRVSSATTQSVNTFVMPVGHSRYLTSIASAKPAIYCLSVLAYRRIGTNQ